MVFMDGPPKSSPPVEMNLHSLSAPDDSRITGVSLYLGGRAEVTRIFKLDIKKGENRIELLGLPSDLLEDTVRIEGRGNASIHDVIISRTPLPEVPSSNAAPDLVRKHDIAEKALIAVRQARDTLRYHLDSVDISNTNWDKLGALLENYVTLARKIDARILGLKTELAELEDEIEVQRNTRTLEAPLTWQVVLDVHGEAEEEITIVLRYAVLGPRWMASYDIRVDTLQTEKVAILLYKAIITQETGESWYGVPLTLETITPSSNSVAPVLGPWNLAVRQDTSRDRSTNNIFQPHRRGSHRSRSRSRERPAWNRSRSASPARPSIRHQTAEVHNSDVVATFCIPGLINIPSDRQKHNVTIAQLKLDAKVIWFSVPKMDPRAFIQAKIKNNSEYTFIPGLANIYVDESFVSTTQIRLINPQETFDCPLGLDPSLRVTYHPMERRESRSGLYQKSSTISISQRISILNTRSTTIGNIKIMDNIPVSQDKRVQVKLFSPPLGERDDQNKKSGIQLAANIKAQWDGTDAPHVDRSAIGKNGKLNWVMALPPQATANLLLQYEVSIPDGLSAWSS